jgi:putative flippase GtrA
VSAWFRAARRNAADMQPLVLEFIRYALCSLMALGVDMGLLLLLHHVVGLHYLLAAAIGFMAGLFVAYALSVRFAFSQRRVADARAEFILFASVGLLGLALTQILLHAFVDGTGMAVAAAKIVTAGFVFLFNFGARKVLLFTQVA